MSPNQFVELLIWYAVFVFSVTTHEAAHAWAGKKLGDDTADDEGLVTLNPTPHMQREPFGMVLIPILSLFSGGYCIGWGSCPYSPVFRSMFPKRSSLVAAAGPISNLIIALGTVILIHIGVSMGLFRIGGMLSLTQIVTSNSAALEGLAKILSILFTLNMVLFILNLIPIPPLDGYNIVKLLIPKKYLRKLEDVPANAAVIGQIFIFLFAGKLIIMPVIMTIFPIAFPWFG